MNEKATISHRFSIEWRYIWIGDTYAYFWGMLWSWLYCSWIYNYLCNQYLSPQTLWVWITLRQGVLDTTFIFVCDLRRVCDFLQVLWFPPPIKLTATI